MGTNVSEKFQTKSLSVMSPPGIEGAVERACKAVAPCWPLKDFVAVNPFLGLSSASFPEVADRMAAVAGARLYMPRAFYSEALATGRITEEDLVAAFTAEPEAAHEMGDLHQLKRVAMANEAPDKRALLPTVADTAGEVTGTEWPAFICDRISRWAAAYYDAGQSVWTSPWRNLQPYAAWRSEALIDRTPAVMGLPGFRAAVALLPESCEELIEQAVQILDLPESALEYYFHRLLMTQGGWAAYARYRDWQRELVGQEPAELTELLAIRLAWELTLLRCLKQTGLPRAWEKKLTQFGQIPQPEDCVSRYAAEILLQHAYEHAWQRQLLEGFEQRPAKSTSSSPAIQAAFCIDVRSEVYRRALEACADDIETMGFAGFFGLPMAYSPLGENHASPQCPALIAPQFVIQESVAGANAREEREIVHQRRAWRHAMGAWKFFKSGAVASFSFVETMGIAYLVKLVTDSFGLTRPVVAPRSAGLSKGVENRLRPRVAASLNSGVATGLEKEAQVNLAASALRGMSRTNNFARLVMLAGHGSSSTNNPHAAGLACGACGGHSGESNARVLASILNDCEVRAALEEQGITVPADTVFVAANHDTTTESVALFDTDHVPQSHHGDLEALRAHLSEASSRARRERAASMGMVNKPALEKAFDARGLDWSQVRPEWGLAGCAAFIAAPRHRTSHLSLGGRTFLHDYDWRQDEEFQVLESIMTAPLVVASWINMQYYASTVDNEVFGSGNKTLHNVVGTLGVLEGNGGDLRVGLPWQSVHDGERLIHEPVRLTAVVEAPIQALNSVIHKHKNLQAMLDNGWIHLFALDARGVVRSRYTSGGDWVEVKPGTSARVVAA